VSFYETSGGAAPALDFLKECPAPVRQRLLAIVVAVRDGPPFSFPSSNMWHVMRDDMKGFHEARDEHDGTLYRLFACLDRNSLDELGAPAVVLICGGEKPVRSAMDERVYRQARDCRRDYMATRRVRMPPGVPDDASTD
jgi:hypothetical protein